MLVSAPGSAPRTGSSTQPAVSADGATVVFSSTVSGLDPDDADPLPDVFARNLRTGALALVSRSDGTPGEKGNDASEAPGISGDGRLVAFSSTATNLDPADLDAVSDVFVRNLALGTTALVSLSDGPNGGKSDADSTGPAISQTGRFVVFTSFGALDGADVDTFPDVYSRDVAAGRTRLLSRAAGVFSAKGDGASELPSLSADARFAAYASAATNLHPDDADALTDVFVRDVLGTVLPLGGQAPRTPGALTLPGPFAGGAGELSCQRDSDDADGRGRPPCGRARVRHPSRPRRSRRPARARRPRLPVRRAGRRPPRRRPRERRAQRRPGRRPAHR